jgi:hypothetical protein
MPSPIPATAYNAAQAAQSGAGAVAASASKGGSPMFGKDGFTFSDFLDIINPFQHIPVVSTIYRAVTGDKIDPGSRIVGGGIFGGPIGLIASMVSGIVEEATGKDPGEHALALVGFDVSPNKEPGQSDTMIAAAPAARSDGMMQPVETAVSQSQAVPAQAAVQDAQVATIGIRTAGDRINEPAGDGTPKDAPPSARTTAPVELPSDLFQALKQAAATQQADARSAATNTATANPVAAVTAPPAPRAAAPMQVNAMPNTAIKAADGRTWFPAHPMGGGGVPTRGVGTQPVTQLNATSKFGSARSSAFGTSAQAATAAAAATVQGGDQQQNEWSNRAADAYQKYFEMQNQKNRRAGVVR